MGKWWVNYGACNFSCDWKYIGEDKNKREVRKNGLPFEIILIVHAVLMVPIIISIWYRGMLDGNALTTWVVAVSIEITSSIYG